MTAAIQSMPCVLQPTVQGGMSFADYVHLHALNWSTLKEMAKSPLHYAHRLVMPRGDRAQLTLGRAAHTCILEPQRWNTDYIVYPGKTRRGKEWDAFKAAHAGMTFLTKEQARNALEMKQAVFNNPIARKYLGSGWPELTLTWTDAASGFPCKGRIDWLANIDGGHVLVDLKSARDIEAHRFGAAAARFGYHSQLAWYERGAKANNLKIDKHVIIAVESVAPFDVAVFTVDEDTLYAGEEECAELVAKVKDCFVRNEWRGRYVSEEPLQLPAWWYAQDADDAENLGLIIGKKADDADAFNEEG